MSVIVNGNYLNVETRQVFGFKLINDMNKDLTRSWTNLTMDVKMTDGVSILLGPDRSFKSWMSCKRGGMRTVE